MTICMNVNIPKTPWRNVSMRFPTSYHLHYAEDLSLEDLARENFMSSYYLSHQFKRITGYTITHYIHLVRIRNCQYLLTNTRRKIDRNRRRLRFFQFFTVQPDIPASIAANLPLNTAKIINLCCDVPNRKGMIPFRIIRIIQRKAVRVGSLAAEQPVYVRMCAKSRSNLYCVVLVCKQRHTIL